MFKIQNGQIVPDDIYSMELSNLSANHIVSSNNSLWSLIIHPDYCKKLTGNKYGAMGNILQYHFINNINTSITSSYNDSIPFAKGNIVTYNILNAVVSAAFATNLETFWSSFNNIAIDNALPTAWNNFNTALRNNKSLSNVLMSIFTYAHQIGMTFQTDPNGISNYHNYDNLGRIKNAKNIDQCI